MLSGRMGMFMGRYQQGGKQRVAGWIWVLPGLLLACSPSGGDGPAQSPGATLANLHDPDSCRSCHASIVEEWEGSMHAYASHDPVFLAMNARGQRETGGELGDFCVRCHAPVAVELGLTSDGLNLHEIDDAYRGVTCYACHAVDEVAGTHNNPLVYAHDKVMRGGIDDPMPNGFHASAYSPLLDRNRPESSSLCGSCHDIVTPNGIHIERTFVEWKDSVYAEENAEDLQTCGSCHMGAQNGRASNLPGSPPRVVHAHAMPGIDTALTPWPGVEAQKELIQAALDTSLFASVCVVDGGDGTHRIQVELENIGAGHSFPSGAALDRRVWVEVVAFDEQGQEVFSSGAVEEGQPVTEVEETDPYFWRIGDKAWKADGTPAHMFWDIASLQSDSLPAPIRVDGELIDPHQSREYTVIGGAPDRVTVRVRVRPLGLDFVDDLIETGDLDPVYRARIPTWDLALSSVEWLAESEQTCVP